MLLLAFLAHGHRGSLLVGHSADSFMKTKEKVTVTYGLSIQGKWK